MNFGRPDAWEAKRGELMRKSMIPPLKTPAAARIPQRTQASAMPPMIRAASRFLFSGTPAKKPACSHCRPKPAKRAIDTVNI